MRYNIFILLISIVFSACSDSFLDEKLTTSQNTDYFKTTEGIDDLSTGCYFYLKAKFGQQWCATMYCMGTDEMTDGNSENAEWNCYTSSLNSSNTFLKNIWDNMYSLIEPANTLISNTPRYYNRELSTYNTRLGEGYFFRAYGHFELVKQFGAIPLKLSPSTDVRTDLDIDAEEECYCQIIRDLEQAYELLPEVGKTETPNVNSARLSRAAAAHFLAKAHLFRASELYSEWNGKYIESDLEAVIRYAQEVYDACGLAPNYSDLWDFTSPNSDNEKLKEVILAAQFYDATNNTTYDRYTNQAHMHFITTYNDIKGCNRDISGGREFGTSSTTTYTVEVFDRVNDSRFWKSFVTCYGCNNTKGAPVWTSEDSIKGMPEGAHVGAKRFRGGDIGIRYIANHPGDRRYRRYRSGNIDNSSSLLTDIRVLKNGEVNAPHTMVMYFEGEKLSWNKDMNLPTSGNIYDTNVHRRGFALSKYRDGSRIQIKGAYGTRDGIIARSAEDVLMLAEAYIRKKDYSKALIFFNILRNRAGFAQDEDREANKDGGQAYKTNTICSGLGGGYSSEGAIYSEKNTYYESNDLESTMPRDETKTAMLLKSVNDIINSTVDTPIYQALGLTTDHDKIMCFLLNERTRELCGEMHRWEDLARTMTLESRYKAFNEGDTHYPGMFDSQKHYRRPLPQSFVDETNVKAGN